MDTETARKQASLRRAFLIVWILVGVILLTAAVVYLLNILSVPVSIIIWTTVIVFCLRGVVNGLEKRGVNRGIGTACAYLFMFVVLGLIGFLLFSPMFGLNNQISNLISSIPEYINGIAAWVGGMYNKYAHLFEDETVMQMIDSVRNAVTSWASTLASSSASGLFDVGTTLANGLMALGFAMVVAYWVLMELPAIGRETMRLIGPRHAEDAKFLHYTFTRVMGGYIKGTVFQCAIIGVGCGVLFAFAGVPNAAALGVITGVLNIIPIIGPWLGGVAAAIVAVFVSPFAAVIALVGTIVIQQFVYTFVSPKIMSNSVDIHPALTLLALMCGSAIGGAMNGFLGSLVGMLASIPAVAVIKASFVYYFEKRTGRQLVAEDGVMFKGVPSEDGTINPMADATSGGPEAPQMHGSATGGRKFVMRYLHTKENAAKIKCASDAGKDGEQNAQPKTDQTVSDDAGTPMSHKSSQDDSDVASD